AGVTGVEPDEMALPLERFGGLVVEPHGGAETARALAGQGEGVAGGIAESGGHLAMPGVEPVLGEEVRLGDLTVPARQSLEDAAVRHGTARHRLDVPEVGAGEAEADRGARSEAVDRFQYDKTAPGADEGGSGAQQLRQGVRE